MFGNIGKQKYGKIPVWNRDKLWKRNLNSDGDEIPKWE